MEVAALIVSVLSLLVAGAALLKSESRWRAERERDVRIAAWHDGVGIDAYTDREEIEHVIAVRVLNLGERPEHVVEIGLQSVSGEPIANNRPATVKIVDEPPPEARELLPRGQVPAQFKVSAEAIAEGFIGYAVLGTGDRIYSDLAAPEQGLGEIEAMVRGAIAEAASQGETVDRDDP